MSNPIYGEPIDILLVEDNLGDIRLTLEVLKESKVSNRVSVVRDGVEAIAYLRQEGAYSNARQPDLILLDLNMPRQDGRETLAIIKATPTLQQIPIVVLTTSDAEIDVLQAYSLHANCYIVKPVDLEQFIRVVRSIEDFWLTIVKLPPTDNFIPSKSAK